MKYTYSQFTGRLSGPPKLSAPSPLDVASKFGHGVEPPTATIHYPVGTTFPKTVSDMVSARRGKYGAVPLALQAKMRTFQIPNGMPVHIKGGPMDKVLFALTGVVCVIGVLECFRVYYVLSYPQKPE